MEYRTTEIDPESWATGFIDGMDWELYSFTVLGGNTDCRYSTASMLTATIFQFQRVDEWPEGVWVREGETRHNGSHFVLYIRRRYPM